MNNNTSKEILERIIKKIEDCIDPEKLAFNGQFDAGLNLAKQIVEGELRKIKRDF